VPDPEDGLAVPGRWMLMTSTDLIFILILLQILVVGQNSFFFFWWSESVDYFHVYQWFLPYWVATLLTHNEARSRRSYYSNWVHWRG